MDQTPPEQLTPNPQVATKTNTTTTIITVLLLIFIWPLGVIVMWLATKWPIWLKLVLTILPLIFLVVMGILAAAILVAINPSEQISKARNAARKNDTYAILKMVQMYETENGELPNVAQLSSPVIIGSGTGQFDLCPYVVPEYGNLPVDPGSTQGKISQVSDCTSPYSTDYTIVYNPSDRSITIGAPMAELGQLISSDTGISNY
jgi:type II secretory pathway pseudopilin PulG